MTTNVQLKRQHYGKVTLCVHGVPAHGAEFHGVLMVQGKAYAQYLFPIEQVTFAEPDNVVPFVRPAQ